MKKTFLLLLLTSVFISISPAIYSATIDVSIKDGVFQPRVLTINVGDTVKWTNWDTIFYGTIPHTTTSGTNCTHDGTGWDSGTLLTAQSFSFTFNAPGTYPYFCSMHCLSAGMTGTIIVGQSQAPVDFEGDGKTDIAIWRPSNGYWYIIRSSDGSNILTQWGAPNDIPVPGDYDGDGKTDVAVWTPQNGLWTIRRSSDGNITYFGWGEGEDVPVPGDYDRDGKTDIAVWRPSNGFWYVINSTTGTPTYTQLGISGDMVVPGDYDGDGKIDIAVWRPSNGCWYIINSSNGMITIVAWGGVPGDIPVPGDYDGDGKIDIAVWRPSNGDWYIIHSSGGTITYTQWGGGGDIPVSP